MNRSSTLKSHLTTTGISLHIQQKIMLRIRLFSVRQPRLARRHGDQINDWRLLSTTTTTTTAQPSMLPRVIGFSVFSLSLGLAAGAYTLVTEESVLFKARDRFPKLINAIAPILGLPQEVVKVRAEEAQEEPTDIKQVVGDLVHVAVKLASGNVIVLECASNETPEGLQRLTLVTRPGDMIVDISVLDKEKAEEMKKKDPAQLGREMNLIHIPEIPSVITMHSLQVALELCRQTEMDLDVRKKLARNENDVANLTRALAEIAQRKRVLKDMIKEENKKQGIRSIFRRNY